MGNYPGCYFFGKVGLSLGLSYLYILFSGIFLLLQLCSWWRQYLFGSKVRLIPLANRHAQKTEPVKIRSDLETLPFHKNQVGAKEAKLFQEDSNVIKLGWIQAPGRPRLPGSFQGTI